MRRALHRASITRHCHRSLSRTSQHDYWRRPSCALITPRRLLLTSTPHPSPTSPATSVNPHKRPSQRFQIPFVVVVSGAAILGASALLVGIGVVGAQKINRTRPRWFSDHFVLTPESLRMPYRVVQFKTEDDVLLEGWFIEQTRNGKASDRVVMCCCPFNHDKSTLLAVARALWDSGHSVFLFDFRSFAPKPVTHETIGHLELRDGRAALRWLRGNKPKEAAIGVMGCSMGGAVALSLIEEDDEEVVGVATDCAFFRLRDVCEYYMRGQLGGSETLARFVVEIIRQFNLLWYGYDIDRVGPCVGISRLRVPLLILHSSDDSVVALEQAQRIYEGATTPPEDKKLVIVQGAEHIGAFFRDQHTYARRIINFLDRCFERGGGEEETQQHNHHQKKKKKMAEMEKPDEGVSNGTVHRDSFERSPAQAVVGDDDGEVTSAGG